MKDNILNQFHDYLVSDEYDDFINSYSKEEALKELDDFFNKKGSGFCHIYLCVLFVSCKTKSKMRKEIISMF